MRVLKIITVIGLVVSLGACTYFNKGKAESTSEAESSVTNTAEDWSGDAITLQPKSNNQKPKVVPDKKEAATIESDLSDKTIAERIAEGWLVDEPIESKNTGVKDGLWYRGIFKGRTDPADPWDEAGTRLEFEAPVAAPYTLSGLLTSAEAYPNSKVTSTEIEMMQIGDLVSIVIIDDKIAYLRNYGPVDNVVYYVTVDSIKGTQIIGNNGTIVLSPDDSTEWLCGEVGAEGAQRVVNPDTINTGDILYIIGAKAKVLENKSLMILPDEIWKIG